MQTVLRIGIWTLASIIVLLATAYLYLRNADLSVYEPQIESLLSKETGHDFDIAGDFEIRFGRVTHVTAEGISVRNADWQPDATILTVGQFSVSVDLWSLVTGPIVIENLHVRDVILRLERKQDGSANWHSRSEPSTEASQGPFDRNLVAFRELRVEGVQFSFVDAKRPKPLNVILTHLTLDPDAANVLDLDLEATINELPLQANGELGPWPNLVDGQDVFADVKLSLGRSNLVIDGHIADLVALEGIEASIEVFGPTIDRVIDALGMPPFAAGEFRVVTHIAQGDSVNLVNVDGNLGAITVSADGSVDSFVAPGNAEFRFDFAGPDAKYVAEVFGIEGLVQAPFDVAGQFRLRGSRFALVDTTAQFAAGEIGIDGWVDLRRGATPDGDVTVSASGPDLSQVAALSGIRGIPADPFSLSGRIRKQGAAWGFDDFRFEAGANRLSVDGEMDSSNGATDEISVTASGPDVSIFLAMAGLQGLPASRYDISVRLLPDEAGVKLENGIAVLGENRLEIDGVLGLRDGLSGTGLEIRASGPELQHIALLADVSYLPAGAFDLSGHATVRGDTLRIVDARIAIAAIEASASGTVELDSADPDVDLQLAASGPDLAALAKLDFLQKFPGESFEVSGRLRGSAGDLRLDGIDASVGELRATVDGRLGRDRETADLRVSADAPDAAFLEKLSGVESLPEGVMHLGGRIEKTHTDLEFSDTEFRVGEYVFSADGTLSRSPGSNRSDLRFSLSGPELRQIGLPFGYGGLPRKNFTISGEVNGTPAGFAVDNLIARIGENDISAAFKTDLRDKPEITGDISSTFVDLESRLIQQEDSQADTTSDVEKEFFFFNQPIDNRWLHIANVDIDMRAGRAILSRADIRDVRIRLRLWDGILDIDPISFRELTGSVHGRFHLEPDGDGYSLDAAIAADNMHIGLRMPETDDRLALPRLDGNLELRGSGKSLHEILASSYGLIDLRQGAGQVRKSITSEIFGDLIIEVVRKINPLSRTETHTKLECGIYRVNIQDGMATIDNIALQSDRLTVVASGTVDLDTEQLNVTLRSKTREGIGVSIGGVVNSFLKLGGTLQKPRIQLDPTSSVTTGGVAVATGGLSLLAKGLWDRVSAESDICKGLAISGN